MTKSLGCLLACVGLISFGESGRYIPDHGDSSPAGGLVSLPGIAVGGDDGGDDNVAGCHANGAYSEDGLAADTVDVEDRRDSGDEHDDADDAGCEERNCDAGKAEVFENGGSIIEDRVDSGPLLEEPIEILVRVLRSGGTDMAWYIDGTFQSGSQSKALRLRKPNKFTRLNTLSECKTYIVTVATMTRLNMAFVLKRDPIATN